MKNRSSTMLESFEAFFYRSRIYGIQGNGEKRKKKVGVVHGISHAFFLTFGAEKLVAKNPTLADQDLHASSKLTSLRESAWSNAQLKKIMRIASPVSDSIRWVIIILCTNLFRCSKRCKIPDAEAAVDKDWEKLEKLPAWQLTKVRDRKQRSSKTRRKKGGTFILSRWWTSAISKNSELEPKFQKYKGRVVLRRDTVKDDSNCYSVFTEQSSSASQMTGTKGVHLIVRKFIPMPQAMRIPDAKAKVEKECENWEKIPAWQLSNVRNKNEVIAEARNEGRAVHFASLMDLCHLKNSELQPKCQKFQGRVVLRGDIVKDGSSSYAVFTEQGSSASQMTALDGMHVIARLPGCAGQAADAVSTYTNVKMEDDSALLKFPKSECQDIGTRLPRHK